MKKYFLLLPGALLPYLLLFAVYCVLGNLPIGYLIFNNIYVLVLYLFIFFAVAATCDIIFLVLSVKRKWNSKGIALANMIVKLAQVPAFIAIFILGFFLSITIFTILFSVFFIIYDCMTIYVTGLTGISAVIRNYDDKKFSKRFAVANAFLQFAFCVDVISAVIIYKKSKKQLSS